MEKTDSKKVYSILNQFVKTLPFDRLDCSSERPILYKQKDIKPFKYHDFPVAGRFEKVMDAYVQAIERPSASPKAKELFRDIYVYPTQQVLSDAGVELDVQVHRAKLRERPYARTVCQHPT